MKRNMSYKMKLILTGIALLLAVVGTTYAWWTASYRTEETISMGNLKITGNFNKLTELENYEPGTTAELTGEIQNTGSIPTIIKVENNSLVQLAYSDENLTLIPEADREFVADQDGVVSLKFSPTSQDYESGPGFWFKDANENIYLLLDPKDKVEVMSLVYLDGDKMGNIYQDSRIKVGALLKATQVMEGAIQKEFDISTEELQPMENHLEQTVKHRATSKGMERLNELLKR